MPKKNIDPQWVMIDDPPSYGTSAETPPTDDKKTEASDSTERPAPKD
jgi:hypothetical protein